MNKIYNFCMSKYSEFSTGMDKTRVEGELENQLLNITNYKNQSQHFGELDGLDKRGSQFGFEIEKMMGDNAPEKNEDKTMSAIFNDPRYNQKDAREGSRKKSNLNTTNKTLSGLDSSKYSVFSESNFEETPSFSGLSRGMELNTGSLVRGQGDVTINGINGNHGNMIKKQEQFKQNLRQQTIEEGDENIDDIDMPDEMNPEEMRKKQIHLQNIRNMQIPEKQKQLEQQKMGVKLENNEQQQENKKQTDTDLARIIKKIKNIDITDIELPLEETKPVLRMPKKNIVAGTVKGKILQFKNCDEEVQDMISHAFINIWAEDFKMKNITTFTGVKQFILENFKDKLNAFFVLFDDDGDFISTFAVDVENFAPFISHLFVNPTLRNKGFGKKTIKYGEKYIKKLGFNSSNLWCEEHLVPFYRKNGYIIESKIKISETKEVWKMSKNLD